MAAPLAVDEVFEPEPDLAVVPRQRYEFRHPDRAELVVEVAETSLRKDLVTKARVYAAAGVPAYWVIDLTRDAVYVHDLLQPRPQRAGRVEPVEGAQGAKERLVRQIRGYVLVTQQQRNRPHQAGLVGAVQRRQRPVSEGGAPTRPPRRRRAERPVVLSGVLAPAGPHMCWS